ncbi:MAG: sulfatase [Kiritimatiellae bacterium]|nr:sulfatase [Kiritimatiellia bacterium]
MTSGKRPNILFAISDDQSWPHASAYGHPTIRTPAFDRVAREGVLFTHGFCPASQCSPSRAAVLTGRQIWQLAEAGSQDSVFPNTFPVYTDLLEAAGYHLGYTGKPWAPGNWAAGGWRRNPSGPEYNARKLRPPTTGISTCDYAANFKDFLDARPAGSPFCFWFGCREPHRDYERDSGIRAGKDVRACVVPPYLPDVDVVRRDLLDYELEIEWFDAQLGLMLDRLAQNGELENTLVAVTSDNGMPFPRAKANLYEQSTRVPLAVCWGGHICGGRAVDDLVSLVDLAPTFLEAAGLAPPGAMSGRSLMNVLKAARSGCVDAERNRVYLGKERHNHARFDNVGYPSRAIRTPDHLYIRNFKPDRWPLGDPPEFLCHTKMANPCKAFILEHQREESIAPFYAITYAKRRPEELFAVRDDPFCLRNLAQDADFAALKQRLWRELECVLREQADPRVLGYGDIWDSYPYFGPIERSLGGFNEKGAYNPEFWRRACEHAPEGAMPPDPPAGPTRDGG